MDRKIIPQRKRNQPVDRSVPEDTSNQNQKRRHIPHTPKNSNPNKLNHTMCCNSRLQSITHYAVNNAARVIKVLGRMEAAVNHEYMVRPPRPAPPLPSPPLPSLPPPPRPASPRPAPPCPSATIEQRHQSSKSVAQRRRGTPHQ